MVKTFRLQEFGFEVEINKVARQADGAAWLKHGGTVVLATVVSSPSENFPGFFPLTVDYREQFAAAGKIPGGYFKREGRLSDTEVLISRLIDRSIRPLFPKNYFDQVQVLTTVYSVDKNQPLSIMGLIASSLAITISKIPLLEPIGAVEVARVNGQWMFNPTYQDSKISDVRLIVAGTKEGICMVEGAFNELSEAEIIDMLFQAHDKIKKIVAWQLEIKKELAVATQEIEDGLYNWDTWENRTAEFLTEDRINGVHIADKTARNNYLEQLKNLFSEQYAQIIEDEKADLKVVMYVYKDVLKEKISDSILSLRKRVDARNFDEIRPITTEVGLLPFTHGSALFTRGQTQALVTTTLGGGQDEQRIETIMEPEETHNNFMLNYNFPPFSVGEVRALRGPGRREIGHGHLAASSFKYLLPDKESFPYTIRLVADMLESNGSTSMATVCGSTMALMDAGVPLKKMVAGIAMGLLKKNNSNEIAVLSDITGFEDDFGLMDFKVVGTDNGVTAIQMDIKSKTGFSKELFLKALEQARLGRLHILGEMRKVMTAPNAQLSDLVPKVYTLNVHTDKIGGIIGGGGKTIREIIEKTKTSIDIEPDGLVKIFGGPDANIELAINWVKTLAGQIDKGAIFTGKIRRFAEFGMFVELVPGLDGLVHISNIPRDMQKTFAHDLKLDQVVKVEVLDHDTTTGRTSLKLLK